MIRLLKRWRRAASTLLIRLSPVFVDGVHKLTQARPECGEQALKGVPAYVQTPGLGVGDVRLARAGACGELLLCEPGLGTQRAECSTKDEPVVGGVGHGDWLTAVPASWFGTCQVRRVAR